MKNLESRQGWLFSLPMIMLLAVSFLAPLFVVLLFSVMPQKAFSLSYWPTMESYYVMLNDGYLKSLAWSLGLAFVSTLLLFLICYPLAYGMAKVFGRFTLWITIAVVVSLFVSENIRLYGWVLTLMKGGLFTGYLSHYFGIEADGLLYNVPVIVFGLIYVYLPFMLFPLAQGISMVPDEVRQAAVDLGATRWQLLWEVDLPLAMPGIVVGNLLTFVLATGAVAESKLLGGQSVIVMADEIETAFTYGQNWPLGSALAMMLVGIIGALAYFALGKIDLDAIVGRREV